MGRDVDTITYTIKGHTIIVGAGDPPDLVWPLLLIKVMKKLFGGKYRLTVNKYMADNLASSDRDIREIRGFERVKQLQRLLEAYKKRRKLAPIKDDLEWLFGLSAGVKSALALVEPGAKQIGPETRWIGSSAREDSMVFHNFDPEEVIAVLKDFAKKQGMPLVKEQ